MSGRDEDRDELYRDRPRGLEERMIAYIGALLVRADFLTEKKAQEGRLHFNSEAELEGLRWVLSDCVSPRYPTLIESAQAWADEQARRRAVGLARKMREGR